MGPPALSLATLSLGPQRDFTQGMTRLDLHFVKLPGFVGTHTDGRPGRGRDDEALLCPGQRRRGRKQGLSLRHLPPCGWPWVNPSADAVSGG